ncbi:hypothetical protein FOA52_005424 [Chlamydomonas sp. UWO 241]|nr:hypothetical protein FOA52_005424 [Chlamydomonas sp. UWO 241]
MRAHILPRLEMMVPRHALHQLERAGRWLSGRRHRPAGEGGGEGGARGGGTHREEARLEEEALQAERASDPERAMLLYTRLVSLSPTATLYARLSKQYSDMMYMPGARSDSKRAAELNAKAVELAMQAVANDPECAVGHVALCVSRGRLALCVPDNRKKVNLARDAADDAATALRLDPSSDLAHHLMGRWHYEMAQLGPIVRYVVRVLFGAALMQGTFPEALTHFRTAQTLCPVRLIHTVEVGRTLHKLGHTAEAASHLEAALAMDVEDLNAQLQKEDAAAMLAQMRRSGKGLELWAGGQALAPAGQAQAQPVSSQGSGSIPCKPP